MRRRDVIWKAACALTFPLAGECHSAELLKIGFLGGDDPQSFKVRLSGFHDGLLAEGLHEGADYRVIFRWAEGNNPSLARLAEDLVAESPDVIAAMGSSGAALAAKAATDRIPIVFQIGNDPVRLGLVDSLSRPGGNITGIVSLNFSLLEKRLEILNEILPAAEHFLLVSNPTNPAAVGDRLSLDLEKLASEHGKRLTITSVKASTEMEIRDAFNSARQANADGVLIGSDSFFVARSGVLATLAQTYRMPAIFQYHEFVTSGGLVSYGGDLREVSRLAGTYVGRVLRGERVGALPVQQSSKAELLINLKTARLMGIRVPESVLARADEVIE